MRAKEFLIEKPLDPKALFDPGRLDWRPQAFLDKLKAGTPFVDKQGNEYYPEKGEDIRLTPIVNKVIKQIEKNNQYVPPDIKVNIKGVGPMSTKEFEKADLQKPTGWASSPVNVQPIGIGIATEPRAAIKGKKKETVTTDQAIQNALDTHKEIAAGKLYEVIMANPALDKAGDLGAAIKQVATEINEGKTPVIKQYDAKTQKTIAIDAGEYLGILAMTKNVAEWHGEKKERFLKFLKASSFDNLLMIFPGEQNASLADSYGVQNLATKHTIMISSKGGVGKSATGAAPALSGLQPSVNKRQKSIKPGNALDFINTMNSTSTAKQCFVGWDWVKKNYPETVPRYLKNLEITEDDINKIIMNVKTRNKTPIPRKFVKFTKAPYMKQSVKGTAGGSVIYFLTKDLVRIINSGIIPDFRETVLQLLDENFVQIFTRVIGGELKFKVLWPGKIDGNVSLYTKLSATELSQSLSFKVTD